MIQLDIPALLISGELDPVTPPGYSEELASYLPNSLHIIIPNASHGGWTVWENCLEDLVEQFFSRADVNGLDASCVMSSTRPPFVSHRDY